MSKKIILELKLLGDTVRLHEVNEDLAPMKL